MNKLKPRARSGPMDIRFLKPVDRARLFLKFLDIDVMIEDAEKEIEDNEKTEA